MSKKFDIVGSLLRPAELLTFKRAIEVREDIAYPFYDAFDGYEEVESHAIVEVVNRQLEAGLEVISDGEFSKSIWHLDFIWGFEGIRRFIAKQGVIFKEKDGQKAFETRRDMGIEVTSRLNGKNHHFVNIFNKIKAVVPENQQIKICIPAPSHIYFDFLWHPNFVYDGVYADEFSLREDLVGAYKDFLADYAAAGGEIVQFDDCRWAMFADDNEASPLVGREDLDLTGLAKDFIALNNELIRFGKSLGLKVWTHNCRGNYRSRHMSTGSYEKIADLFLGTQEYDRFFLEWDDARAGSLNALEVFKDKDVEVVLGLLSSKTSTLDDEERVKQGLAVAAEILGKERLFLSHQCGFASTDHGNDLGVEQQWAKIEQGQRIAREFWGE